MSEPNPQKKPHRKSASLTAPKDEAPAWRERRLVGGRWQDPKKAKKEPRADRTISIRMTEAELAEFDAQIGGLGLNRNRALRIAARRIGGFLEVDGETVEALRAINRQLAGVATSINQIAHAANRTHDPDYRAFMAQRAELGRILIETRGALQRILDVLFLLDEFASLGKMEEMGRAITTVRYSGAHLMLIVQSLANLREVYGAEGAANFMGNCDLQLFMAPTDLDTPRYISEAIGDQTRMVRVKS